MPPAGSHSAGFTLFELLAVLAIGGLVLTFAVPAITSTMPNLQMKAAARDFASTLSTARSRAIAQNRETLFIVDLSNRGYWIEGTVKSRKWPDFLRTRFFTAVEDLRDEAQGQIIFYPDGTTTGGELTFIHEDNEISVAVDWLTGRTRIAE